MARSIYTLTVFSKDEVDEMLISWAGPQDKVQERCKAWVEEQYITYLNEGDDHYNGNVDGFSEDFYSFCGTYSELID